MDKARLDIGLAANDVTLTPEQYNEALIDLLIYGETYWQKLSDGTYMHVKPCFDDNIQKLQGKKKMKGIENG